MINPYGLHLFIRLRSSLMSRPSRNKLQILMFAQNLQILITFFSWVLVKVEFVTIQQSPTWIKSFWSNHILFQEFTPSFYFLLLINFIHTLEPEHMLLQVMCLSTSRLEHPNPPSESLLCSLIKGVFGTTSPSSISENHLRSKFFQSNTPSSGNSNANLFKKKVEQTPIVSWSTSRGATPNLSFLELG